MAEQLPGRSDSADPLSQLLPHLAADYRYGQDAQNRHNHEEQDLVKPGRQRDRLVEHTFRDRIVIAVANERYARGFQEPPVRSGVAKRAGLSRLFGVLGGGKSGVGGKNEKRDGQ
jgi:hypothetical protein